MRKVSKVIDPNETWGQFFRSMAEFKDPNTVPLEKLSEGFDPSQRKFNSLKTLINWRGQNYIEDFKPIVPDGEREPDEENRQMKEFKEDDMRKNIEVIKLTHSEDDQEADNTI